MRLVLDTNVLVSGLLNPHGPPGRILESLMAERLVALFDDRILREYRIVLARRKVAFEPAATELVLATLESTGEHVVAAPLDVRLPDPDDLPFLEVAASAFASALVTGNARHFAPTRGEHKVRVHTPAAFLRKIRAATAQRTRKAGQR